MKLIDMINSRYNTNCYWEWYQEELIFKTIASVDIEAGEELFQTYGVRSNHNTYFTYGFMDIENPNMEATIEICID